MSIYQSPDNQKTILTLSELTGNKRYTDPNLYLICYSYRRWSQCSGNSTIVFKVSESSPWVRFEPFYIKNAVESGYKFYNGFVHNGSISDGNGAIYSPEKSCNTYYDGYTNETQTTCCTKFLPAASSRANVPKCKRFQSNSSIYNGDYSMLATAMMNYTLKENQIFTEGNFSQGSPKDLWFPLYLFNSNARCQGKGNSDLKCIINMTYGDSRNFVSIYFFNRTYGDVYELDITTAGFFIIRNNQTLMQEGVPFTPENNCIQFKDRLYEGYPFSSEFCCIEFDSDQSAITLPSPGKFTTPKQGAEFTIDSDNEDIDNASPFLATFPLIAIIAAIVFNIL